MVKIDNTREKLNMAPYPYCPWTSRPTTLLRGLATQPAYRNFVKETLDVRWMELCVSRNWNADTAMPDASDSCDITQACDHQIRSGSFVLLSKSQIYVFAADRTLTAEEHLAVLGYDISTITFEGISDKIPELPKFHRKKKEEEAAGATTVAREARRPIATPSRSEWNHPVKKRRRVQPARAPLAHRTATIDLGGNAMCLPDVGSILYTALLAMDTTIFENKPKADEMVSRQRLVASSNVFISLPCAAARDLPEQVHTDAQWHHDVGRDELNRAHGAGADGDGTSEGDD